MLRSALRGTTLCTAALLGSLLTASLCFEPRTLAVHASAASNRAAGRALFDEKGCEHCHGVDGVGGEKGPDLLGVGRKRNAEQIRTQILEGGDAMPPFADILAPDDVKLLVDFLSAKKKIVKVKRARPSPGVPTSKPDSGGSDDQ